MCHRKSGHVAYFRPYKDTHGINRVWLCTVWEKDTNRVARGCSILSLDDDMVDDDLGRQYAYNRAARALLERPCDPIFSRKAWEAIQALDPVEMRNFANSFGLSMYQGEHATFGYIDGENDLDDEELNFFEKRGYIMNHFSCLIYEALAEYETPSLNDLLLERRKACGC